AEDVVARANPPKPLLLIHGGNHAGFADVGAGVDDAAICALFPDPTDLATQIAQLLGALGGAADHVAADGCPSTYCTGDLTHIDGRRQQQIGKEAALAFFEDVLRGDASAHRYLGSLAALNPDLTLTAVPQRRACVITPRRGSTTGASTLTRVVGTCDRRQTCLPSTTRTTARKRGT